MNKPTWLLSALKHASRESGRSVPELLLEMITLRTSVGRIGVTEYFDFRLFLDDLSLEEKKSFGGRRGQEVLNDILVDDFSEFMSLDKPTMYCMFKECALPIPEVRALYATERPSKAYLCLRSSQDLMNYLRDASNLPVYIKRSCGSYGRGNTLVLSCSGDRLTLGNRTEIGLREFCESLDTFNGLGWILQEPLQAHPEIAEICGDRVSGVRIHTFLTAAGPQIHRAIWKINVGVKDSDNFHHGGSGNMLAQLDAETGTVVRVIAGIGFDQKVNLPHPISKTEMRGLVIPHWNEIRRLVLDGALAFPGYICPGWDIAVCADGPRFLEVNSFGDIDLSQHAFRRGFIDSQLVAFMRSRGLDGYLHGPAGRIRKSEISHRRGNRRKLHWSW